MSIKKKPAWRDWTESLIFAFITAMIVRTFFFQAFKIPTGSMRTTLMEGDLILVNKLIYGAKIPLTNLHTPKLRDPQQGDVVVFIYPQDRRKYFIKRMVAKGGDKVEIKNGTIYVNDIPLVEPVFNKNYYYNRGEYGAEGKTIIVPADSYFVLGDNSASSQDSRYWGFVPKDNMAGEGVLIYWPPNRIRMIR